jgi:hypothetical protein
MHLEQVSGSGTAILTFFGGFHHRLTQVATPAL